MNHYSTPKESIISGHLAKNLHVLKKGLKLRGTNVPVENPDGAAGFIDIFAEDRWGHKVVIELKRSNQAARQALNEIFKYSGLLQRHYGLKPEDFRVLVVSTTWHELLVPFSECLKDLAFSIEGFQIYVDEFGKITSATKVDPLPEAHLLEFIPHHLIYTFSNSDTRDASFPKLQEKIINFGAKDFVLFCLDYHGSKGLPFPYGIYSCLGTSTEQAIKSRLANLGVLEEVNEWRTGFEGNDFDFWQLQFQQHLFGSFAISDAWGEVSSPEGAEGLSREWKLSTVLRKGRWEGTETVHSDSELWSSVARTDRGNNLFFIKKTSPRFKTEWNSLAHHAQSTLLDYGPWTAFFKAYLKDIATLFPIADVEMHIYNPCDLIIALYYIAAKKDWRFLSTLRIELWQEEQKKLFVFSTLVWDGQTCPSDVETLLSRFYGEPFGYFEHRSLGLVPETFVSLLSAHGFSMPILETQWTNAPEPMVAQITENAGDLIRVPLPDRRPPGKSLICFFEENRSYVDSLLKFFNEYSIGL